MDSDFYFYFFLDEFISSFDSILRFPERQTPSPLGKACPSSKQGEGWKLVATSTRQAGAEHSNMGTNKQKKTEANALHFELLVFTLHCCCPPLLKKQEDELDSKK